MENQPTQPFFVSTRSGPLELSFRGYDTVADFDIACGYVNAALEFACRWHLHRETIDRFAEAFIPKVVELTGIPRGIDKAATEARKRLSMKPDETTSVPESFPRYMKRVFIKIPEEKQDEIKALALEFSRSFLIDVSPVERKTIIELPYYKRADSILEADLETIEEKVKKFNSILTPQYKIERDGSGKPTRDSLARLLQKFDDARWALEE